MVGLDAAERAGFGSEGAGFEEARRPEPFVETRASHASSVLRGAKSRRRASEKRGTESEGYPRWRVALARLWRRDKGIPQTFSWSGINRITTRCCGGLF